MSDSQVFSISSHSTSDPSQRISEITLESEKNSPSYNIHEDLLRRKSVGFNRLLANDEERKHIRLKDVSKDTFLGFSSWLYSQTIEVAEIEVAEQDPHTDADRPKDADEEVDATRENEEVLVIEGRQEPQAGQRTDEQNEAQQNGDEEPEEGDEGPTDMLRRDGRVYLRLVRMYHFGVEYKVQKSFINAVMLRLQRFVRNRIDPRLGGGLPPMPVVNHAVAMTGLESDLSCYLSALWGKYGESEKARLFWDIENTSPTLLADILTRAYRRASNYHGTDNLADPGPRDVQDWCTWHDHRGSKTRRRNA